MENALRKSRGEMRLKRKHQKSTMKKNAALLW
jgi:hypothetical protein